MTSIEKIPNNRIPAPGWIGGFSSSNPAFAYPNPNLNSLPMLGNMDNIVRLKRQFHVLWPEFSWETEIGNPSSRCFEMFAPDISRGGYDNAGRFWSIICPQQGSYSPLLGSLNIEVTVTGQRGWIDEKVAERSRDLLAADISVAGKVWFAPSAKDGAVYRLIEGIFDYHDLPFPLDKPHAIQVPLHRVGDPSEPILPIRSGLNPSFLNPSFATHGDEAWSVANVEVEIGPILTCNHPVVDDFNAVVMDIFNVVSGNILSQGNTLSWNVWFDAPSHVKHDEWQKHAERWRNSIDTGHGSPDGPPSQVRYFDGRPFEPVEALVEREWDKIKAWLERHFDISLPEGHPAHWGEQELEEISNWLRQHTGSPLPFTPRAK
jgi:hypothetical protein